ncbi:hypothetical protein [Helicobacter pylori]|uniref:hypothetical protein n=1 Tax=Helicobacter pylori TaxID=210 RepID=UPI003466385E
MSVIFCLTFSMNMCGSKKADEKKIEQLFDSILRGYPIGSFLFWKLQKEDIAKSDEQDENKLNFQLYQFITNYDERKPHNEKIRIEQIKHDDLYIVASNA